MYIRFSALIPVAALAAAAAAAPSELAVRQTSQCNTGSMHCCSTTTSANNPAIAGLLGLLGIAIGDLTSTVGVACSPITGTGLGSGSSCTQQPVCCNNVYQNGLINLGCSPININL
ncbi:fungal hydrophobin [Lanmaoa asiatica]|nr:fungal hydrophobin [Lanmaoa asiatica]